MLGASKIGEEAVKKKGFLREVRDVVQSISGVGDQNRPGHTNRKKRSRAPRWEG